MIIGLHRFLSGWAYSHDSVSDVFTLLEHNKVDKHGIWAITIHEAAILWIDIDIKELC